MKKVLIILSIIIITLLGLLKIIHKQLRQQRSDAIRWENNYQEINKDFVRIQLTFNEFKQTTTSKEDSLLKELKIKPKQVEKIIYIKNTIEDTNEYIVTLENPTIIDSDYIPSDNEGMGNFIINESSKEETPDLYKLDFIHSIDCLSIQGNVITSDKNIKLSLTNIRYANDLNYIAYWKRRKWKFLGINTRIFGKKQGELHVNSTCGKLTVKEIDIIKKK